MDLRSAMTEPGSSAPAESIPATPLRPRARSLLPKEHGAWAQFFFPLATGLLLAGLDASAWLLAAAATALFFVHEPALVVLGRRGARAKAEAGGRAWRWIGALAAVAAAAGPAGLWLAAEHVRVVAWGVVALGAAVAALVALDVEKTTGGELVAAVAMASAGLVVALGGGADAVAAWTLWGVWCGVFVTATFAVRAVIARSKGQPWGARVAGALLAGPGAVWAAWASGTALAGEAALFTAIGVAPSVALALVPPHARRLRQVGWGLAATCVLVTGFAVRLVMRG